MVDFLQLPISQWLLVFWKRSTRVEGDLEIEYMVTKWLGGAEGGEEEGRSEGLFRGEQLDWKVFLGLRCCQLASSVAPGFHNIQSQLFLCQYLSLRTEMWLPIPYPDL